MATYYLRDRKNVGDLYRWLRKRPWVKNDKIAAYMAGYAEGLLAELTTIWESHMWIRRVPRWFSYDYYRPELRRTISELFFHNKEGFVDHIIVEIPEAKIRREDIYGKV